MRRNISFFVLSIALILLSACQTTEVKGLTSVPDNRFIAEHSRPSPVDVFSTFVAPKALTPQAVTEGQNLFATNGGFELGLEGWTGCSTDAITISSDTFAGTKALKVNSGKCFYRSAQINAGDDLSLSCYAKLESGSAWTGMGLGFADATWADVGPDVPAAIVTGTNYARYDVRATAPANSKYVSMWLYSDNPALVDSCSLIVGDEPPPPPPPSGQNLLENGDFGIRGSDPAFPNVPRVPRDWSIGCSGSVAAVDLNDVSRIQRGAILKDDACVDQGLSASDVTALQGQEYTYSCLVKNTSGYASMSIFFDGQATSKVIPVSTEYQTIKIQGTAGQISNGFVSLYAEGTLKATDCGLYQGDFNETPNPEITVVNGVSGSNTVTTNGPTEVTVSIKNTGNLPFANVSASSNTLDCGTNRSNVAVGESFTFTCSVPALAVGESLISLVNATAVTDSGLTVTASDPEKFVGSTTTNNDLLDNGAFTSIDGNNRPTAWNIGCSGTAGVAAGRIKLYSGACMDQSLSTADLSQLSGNDFTFVCKVEKVGSAYASMSIFLNGTAQSAVIAASGDINITGTAAQLTEGFVSIYAEGDRLNNYVNIRSCNLTVGNNQTSNPEIRIVNITPNSDVIYVPETTLVTYSVENTGNVPLVDIRASAVQLQNCGIVFRATLAVGENATFACSLPRLEPGERLTLRFSAEAKTTEGLSISDILNLPVVSASSSEIDLLDNGAFTTLDANSKPVDWNKGCSGDWSGGLGLSLNGGACIDQSLSTSDLAQLSGKNFSYTCRVKNNTNGYASMSIFLDGAPQSKDIPNSSEFIDVEITGAASQVSSGFVSLYADGDSSNELLVMSCRLLLEDS